MNFKYSSESESEIEEKNSQNDFLKKSKKNFEEYEKKIKLKEELKREKNKINNRNFRIKKKLKTDSVNDANDGSLFNLHDLNKSKKKLIFN